MSLTVNMSQSLAVVGKIDPVTTTIGVPIYTDVVDTSNFPRTLFVVSHGAIGATATVDFALQGCATSGGTYVAIPSAAIATLVTGDSNKVSLLELRTEYLSALGLSYRYVRGQLNPLVAASAVSCVVLGSDGRNHPEANYNLAAVRQIVVY